MEQESIKIHFEDKFVELKYTPFDSDTDLDDITKIHFENIVGEIVTMPALMNRIGLLKAGVDDMFAKEKLNVEISTSGLRKTKRANAVANGVKMTVQELEDEILTDPVYKNNQLKLLRLQKNCNDINSIYWALKSKDDKLNNIKNNLTPKEFETEIIEGTVNQIMIKIHEKKLGKK